jgi:hypothetical protein
VHRANRFLELIAIAALSGARFMQGYTTKAKPVLPGEYVASARNRGKGRTNRQHQRTALKARNVKRHRVACRG